MVHTGLTQLLVGAAFVPVRSTVDNVFITTQDEFVKLIMIKQICHNTLALISNDYSCRFKKPHRNHYSHQG